MPAGAIVAAWALSTTAAAATATMAGAMIAAAVNAAIVGAVIGAATAALSGGNILKGAVRGAVIGGIAGAVGGALGFAAEGTAAAGDAATTADAAAETASATGQMGTATEVAGAAAPEVATGVVEEGGLLADAVSAGNYTPVTAQVTSTPTNLAASTAQSTLESSSNLGGIAKGMKEVFSGIKTGDVFQGLGSMMSGVAQASGAKDVAETNKEIADEAYKRRQIDYVAPMPGVQITGVRQPINYNKLPINYQGV